VLKLVYYIVKLYLPSGKTITLVFPYYIELRNSRENGAPLTRVDLEKFAIFASLKTLVLESKRPTIVSVTQ